MKNAIGLLALLAAISLRAAPDGGRTITVAAGDDLQTALNAAQPGDTIRLAAGATYTGNFVLPAKSDSTSYIVVQTAASPDAPRGTRIRLDDAGTLARLRSPNGGPALATAPGSHHWRVQELEFLSNSGGQGEIIRLGTASQGSADVPHDLVLQRLLILGDEARGQKRGIALNSASTVVRDSYIADIGVVGQDSQALCGWNGPGPFLIENNYLEAAAENIMFGGADPSIAGLVPSDIVVRGNHLRKPLEWRTGRRWTVKNLFELKNARRVLIEGNVMENSWRDGQSGNAILFNVRNQDGRAPWSVIEDVTLRYNIVRHVGGAISILGRDNNYPSGQARGIEIRHNLFYDVDSGRWGGSGRFMLIGGGPREVVIDHNTILQSDSPLYVYGLEEDPAAVVRKFTFTNNITFHRDYGIAGAAGGGIGRRSIERYFPDGLVDRNVLAGGRPGDYDGQNFFPSVSELMSNFADPSRDDYRLRDDSRFRALATDGGPLGANFDRITPVMRLIEPPGRRDRQLRDPR